MRKALVLFILLLSITSLFSQETIETLGVLPNEVSETSGLLFYNGKLITHNDSGNTSQLFEIDTVTLEIIRVVTISGVENIDWEDLAQDDTYIYIGDFGNNIGTRTNLRIFRIDKQAYDTSDTVAAEQISFSYEDQTDFSNTGNSDWDAEAFFVLEDQLIVLTKQWRSNGTVAYTLPKIPGTFEAKRLDSYASNGLITGATYNPTTKVLFIIGYTDTLSVFILQLNAPTAAAIFEGEIIRTDLNTVSPAQVEAIDYVDEETYFFSSESFTRNSPAISLASQLYKFKIVSAREEPEPEPEPDQNTNTILVYKPRLSDVLEYESGIETPILKRSIFDVLGREVQQVSGENIQGNRIDIASLQNGIYYLTFYFSDGKKVIPFFKD